MSVKRENKVISFILAMVSNAFVGNKELEQWNTEETADLKTNQS